MLTFTHARRAIAPLATVAAFAGVAIPSTALAQTAPISCRSVAVESVHGGGIAGSSHLSVIRDGKVLALNANTGRQVKIRFTARSGRWLRSTTGLRYAQAGQTLTRDGRPGGAYLVAAPTRDHRVPCAGQPALLAVAADSAGRTAGADTSLPMYGVHEVAASSRNVGGPLRNWSTQRVCTNTQTHPDGAARVPGAAGNPSPNVWCFTGPGAWLNDPNGLEREADGSYATSPQQRHYITLNSATVAAAKRPNAKGNGEAILNSAIAWRPTRRTSTTRPASRHQARPRARSRPGMADRARLRRQLTARRRRYARL